MQSRSRNPYTSPKTRKVYSLKPSNSKKLLADFLQTPSGLKRSSLFNAFSHERDHIGRLISVKTLHFL